MGVEGRELPERAPQDGGRADSSNERRAGMRPLDGLRATDATALGAEVDDLAVLRAAGVPVARGWVIAFDSDVEVVAARLARALLVEPETAELRKSVPPRPATPRCLKLRPWFRTMALGVRAADRWPALSDVHDPNEVLSQVRAAFDGAHSSSMATATAHVPGGVQLRAIVCDDGPVGSACSVDPDDGDPSCVAIWLAARAPWRFDRKTMRPLEHTASRSARGVLPESVLERVADLVDRAQIALGRPVDIDWVLYGGWPRVARVRPVRLSFRFTDETWRMVSLLWHDEGPVAPLAVDALDKALREEGDAVDEPRVRRWFARPYRRIEAGRGRRGERRHSFGAAAARVAQTASDVARPITAARAFDRTLTERLRAFDADDLSRVDSGELARMLRERQQLVIEAYELLDRGRKATVAVLGALEAALGSVPRDCVHGLAAIRRPRARRRLDERLARAAGELGQLPTTVDPVPAPLRRTFAELRRELAARRPLGLDVRPLAYGASDAALVAGMRAARDGRAERAELEQRQAIRRLMATARSRPLGRGRAALARTLTMMIERLADAKGRVAEGLAAANLRVRDAAEEVGRRLVDRGILDEPDDALYLYMFEIQEALAGEPGAYTARVRLRREEDARWRRFEPPTRVLARPRPLRPTYESPE